MTSPKAHSASRTFSWRLRLCSLKVNATLLQLCGSRWQKLRFLRDLLASVTPKQNNESKQADQIFKSFSTKFAPFVAKARWSVRRKGDWNEIAKLKAKYSSLDLPPGFLPACAAAVSFVATLFAGAWIFRAATDAAGQHSCRFAQTHFFFAQRMFV